MEDSLSVIAVEMDMSKFDLVKTIIGDWLIANAYLPVPLNGQGMKRCRCGSHGGGCTDEGVLIDRPHKRGLMMDEHNHDVHLAELTADVVSAYVANNPVPVGALPDLIASVHASLSGIRQPVAADRAELIPAVNPNRSIFPDYLVSLEDGKKFKSLKRHLATSHNLTPDEYRTKWGLPRDYPMVAPNYAADRSAMAKSIGLGRKTTPAKAPVKHKAKERA